MTVDRSVLRGVVTGLLICYWIIIFTGTHLPPSDGPGKLNDKLLHFFAYFGLATLLAAIRRLSGRSVWPFVVAVCAAYGVVDELTQLLVDRDASVLDWLADVAGASLATLLAHVFRREQKGP